MVIGLGPKPENTYLAVNPIGLLDLNGFLQYYFFIFDC